ncbi:hypothetical protein RD792_007871 [Penstemon davidsonii]|uniref:Protein SMG7L n=1 Tax=Penstemon davidsonii TaxID=160366 RepID=A0ABR0D8J1_9LAMI|nr:hypothetical protein RD792_007871 [Penstemon davidsonii]
MVELQEIEYHLWKLHYKLIDEFRKRIRQQSSKATEFKTFLSEATEFYRDLIIKLRKNCGIPAEIFLGNKDSSSFSIEITKLQSCQYACHRLLICLGDLARYNEIVKKSESCEWSTAATYYLEATRTWPDSGNPHNQLALLATYVGDAFLALYHCVRSLAVKEPFPDAWSNLMLVFEGNRSTQVQSRSNQTQFDFLNPSKKTSLAKTSTEHKGSPNKDELEDIQNEFSEKNDLWPILVKTLSFLLIRSSLEEFPSTFATALHSLEALLSMDDTKLSATLESYKYMDSTRRGPYRAIQLASVFIFIAQSLSTNPEKVESISSLTPLAFAAIFICMGRLVERCTNGNQRDKCPLLPAVLVFVEWLVEALDTIEAHEADERVMNAMSYFFSSLVDMFDRVDQCAKGEGISPVFIALWEDHELRGFYSLTSVHEKLDFTTHLEFMDDFRSGNEYRCRRLFHAAERFVNRSKIVREWFSCNKVGRVFDSSPKTEFTAEEEEVILFKPITRRNSAPIYIPKDSISPEEDTEKRKSLPDEIVRRATSLSFDQSQEEIDTFSFKNSTSHLGPSPPSLSAWVLTQGIQEIEREKGPKDFNKTKLSPIEEIASTSFSDLSINETNGSDLVTGQISTIVHKSPPYVTPTPSAPLLPDDDDWLRGNSLILGNEANGILGAAPVNGYTNRSPIGFVDSYPPVLGMSSSEWLYHYRNSQNNNISPVHYNAPIFGNFDSNEVMGFDVCDQWGNRFVSNPMVYMEGPQMYQNSRDKVFLGYQRSFPYVCGVGMEMSSEQPPLLQYLKEKEWQLQPGSQFRGPTTFRGN